MPLGWNEEHKTIVCSTKTSFNFSPFPPLFVFCVNNHMEVWAAICGDMSSLSFFVEQTVLIWRRGLSFSCDGHRAVCSCPVGKVRGTALLLSSEHLPQSSVSFSLEDPTLEMSHHVHTKCCGFIKSWNVSKYSLKFLPRLMYLFLLTDQK